MVFLTAIGECCINEDALALRNCSGGVILAALRRNREV